MTTCPSWRSEYEDHQNGYISGRRRCNVTQYCNVTQHCRMRRKVKFIDKGVDSRTIPGYNRNPRQVILLDFMPGQIFLHRFSHLPKNFSSRQLFLRTSIVVFAIATQFLVAKLGFAQQDIKRGLGSGGFGLTESINGRWGYNWNYTRPNSFDGEYVPMLWLH